MLTVWFRCLCCRRVVVCVCFVRSHSGAFFIALLVRFQFVSCCCCGLVCWVRACSYFGSPGAPFCSCLWADCFPCGCCFVCCGVFTARTLVRHFAFFLQGCCFSVVCCCLLWMCMLEAFSLIFWRARRAFLHCLCWLSVFLVLFSWLRHLVLMVLLSGVCQCTKPTFMQSVGELLASTLGVLSFFCHCLLWLSLA